MSETMNALSGTVFMQELHHASSQTHELPAQVGLKHLRFEC
jgi:hypothetical protein